MGKGVITFNQLGRYGRFGNQMFQIASVIGIARKNNFDYAFPYWKNYDHEERFGTKEDIDIQKYFVNQLPVYNGNPAPDNFIDWGYWPLNLSNLKGNLSLNGHMQSEKYFIHCSEEIKYYFKMKDEYQINDFCAVHVRLGDYDDNYHPRLKMDYYNKAMSMMPAGTKFKVFSDDIEKAMEMFGGYKSDSNISYSLRSYLDDFKFMKSCKHFIIGNSTYSWWAAWLGGHRDKKVIAPATWFGQIANLSTKDIYANNWIII
jgi:hypothetical protein